LGGGGGANTFNEVFGRTATRGPDEERGGSTGGGCAALATGMVALPRGRTSAARCVSRPPSVGSSDCGRRWASYRRTPPTGCGTRSRSQGPWPARPKTSPSCSRRSRAERVRTPVPADRGRDFVAAVRAGPTETYGSPIAPTLRESASIRASSVSAATRRGRSVKSAPRWTSSTWTWLRAAPRSSRSAGCGSRVDAPAARQARPPGHQRRQQRACRLEHRREAAGRGGSRAWPVVHQSGNCSSGSTTCSHRAMAVRRSPWRAELSPNHRREEDGHVRGLDRADLRAEPHGAPGGVGARWARRARAPRGLQIVGRPQGEEAVLALAGAVAQLRPIGRPALA